MSETTETTDKELLIEGIKVVTEFLLIQPFGLRELIKLLKAIGIQKYRGEAGGPEPLLPYGLVNKLREAGIDDGAKMGLAVWLAIPVLHKDTPSELLDWVRHQAHNDPRSVELALACKIVLQYFEKAENSPLEYTEIFINGGDNPDSRFVLGLKECLKVIFEDDFLFARTRKFFYCNCPRYAEPWNQFRARVEEIVCSLDFDPDVFDKDIEVIL